jgi:hypothetical protein
VVDPAIGQVLVPAVGVSISPVPVAAGLVILLAGRPRGTSAGFLAGWLTGIALVLAAATRLGHLTETGRAAGSALSGLALALVLGLVLLALAARTWRRCVVRGPDRGPPVWITAVDSLAPGRALAVGLLLAVANPKNLALMLPAGIALARARLPAEEQVLVGVTFVLVATSTVLVPMVVHRALGPRVDPALNAARRFLTRHGTVISVALLLMVGIVLAAQGAGGLVTTLQTT